MARDFNVFQASVPGTASFPWHQDWRLGRDWPPSYFRSYDHHGNAPASGEVKFPWELSRLTFLPLLAQADAIDQRCERTRHALEILSDWHRENPLAHCVNWYPMEAAMRAIQLVFFADMVRQIDPEEGSGAELLLEVLAQHGEFIARTIEVTDNAGNHLAAELVALLLLGRTLEGIYPPAKSWFRFAERRIGAEIARQFLEDGVNFEKSTTYHHLVLDLFLLAAVALERAGKPLGVKSMERLHAAALYNAAFIRPDGLCPIVGDSDDAVVFGFDGCNVRDHDPGLSAMAVMSGDPILKETVSGLSVAAVWLFGEMAPERWLSTPKPSINDTTHFFPEGGVFVAKNERNYLFVDVGEVGQNGHGGHGHNDLLGFELMLNGVPLVVDPGSYLYSGDFPAHDDLRTTRAHNGIVVDGEEIAEIQGHFRIAGTAIPKDVQLPRTDNRTGVAASHSGFERLPDPVRVRREITIDLDRGRLRCDDHLEMEASHDVRRYIHFDPSIDVQLHERELEATGAGRSFGVTWDTASEATLLDDVVSPYFGELEPSVTLELRSELSDRSTLTLEIEPREETIQ